MPRLTTEQINEAKAINLLSLIGTESELRQIAAKELAGPCPFCGGNDRFHVQPQSGRWFCRQCTGEPSESGWQDAIDYVCKRQGVGFRQAVSLLISENVTDNAFEARARPVQRKGPSWNAPTWQKKAKAALGRAQQLLDSETGSLGQKYLASRAIQPATWKMWDLGLTWVRHPIRHSQMPAVVLPWWHTRQLCAMQYRFIQDDLQSDERYGQRKGGERLLFGSPLLRDKGLLILVEGELNALSIWQVYGETADVLSWGPQGNLIRSAVQSALHPILQRCTNLVVWADDAKISRRYLHSLAPMNIHLSSAHAIYSPDGLDANNLLQKRQLQAFVDSRLSG